MRVLTVAVAVLLLGSTPVVRAQTTAEGPAVSVQVPDGWTANESLPVEGGPLLLTNFGGRYDRGGILPPGGAEIDVARVAMPAGTLGEYVRHELTDADIESTTERSIGGLDAVRLVYRDTFGPALTYANVTYYIRRGDALYKFYLTARSDDPRWPMYVALFDGVVAQVRFR